MLRLDNGIKRVLPSATSDARIGPGEVRLGDVQIQLRLSDRFVTGIEQGFGFGANLGA